jgi:hypothetical protein
VIGGTNQPRIVSLLDPAILDEIGSALKGHGVGS